MTTIATGLDPAELLLGLTLPKTGWVIVEQLPSTGGTGGTFGTGYIAEKGGRRAFVKAIDFVSALSTTDPIAALSTLTQCVQFEDEIHRFCSERRMSKVIGYVGSDEIIPPIFASDPIRRVFCLILEQGDSDLRRKLVTLPTTSCAWKLAVVRDVSQAVSQLHANNIAHQDVKPSNVIAMTGAAPDPAMKLGDLGRVVRKSGGPYNGMQWPGAKSYAPTEVFYGFRAVDWHNERESADAFMVGSLAMFLFTGTSMGALLMKRIPPALQPGTWRGGYDSMIKAALTQAQSEIIDTMLRPVLPELLKDPICLLVRELTHPDPEKRGDARARRLTSRPVGMDRVFQRLQLLAQKAKLATYK